MPRISILALTNRLALPAKLLVVALVIVLLAHTILYVVAGPQLTKLVDADYRPQAPTNRAAVIDKIVAANLFGTKPPEEIVPLLQNIEETKLNLRLLAIFQAIDRNGSSTALISNTRNPGQTREYRESDVVAGLAKIEKIEARRVILVRNGTREQLTFLDVRYIRPQTRSVVHVDSAASLESSTGSTTSPENANQVTQRVREFAQSLADGDIQDDDLIDRLGVSTAVSSAGNAVRVVDAGLDIDFLELGLRPGDLIHSVNGVRVTELKELLRDPDFANVHHLRLEVERGDRRFYVAIQRPQ